jgi:hypothetical protein
MTLIHNMHKFEEIIVTRANRFYGAGRAFLNDSKDAWGLCWREQSSQLVKFSTSIILLDSAVESL